jgi:hypothetical protein
MDESPEAAQEKRRGKSSPRQTPPLAVLVLFGAAFSLLQFDEANFSSWPRLAAIWATTLGLCLLAMAATYSLTGLRKRPTGVIVSNSAYAMCLIACCWGLVVGIRDTRRALDPNRWLEIGMEFESLPFQVEEGETFYDLNLDPKANDGLHRVQATGTQKLFWPVDRQAGVGKTLYWPGWLCTFRNRGMYPLSNITFDTPVSYTHDSHHELKEWTVHHVRIPMLAPNESLKLLLGYDREGVFVEVYKPKIIVARVGNEANERTLQTRLLPIKLPLNDPNYWFLSGPSETTSFDVSNPARSNPLN